MTKSSGTPERPLSPHLQIYKPQLTSMMSILHRMTGVGLAVGLPVFVYWLVAVMSGPQAYADFLALCHTCVGQILLFGWTFAFFYHLCCGIRHLFWDAGYLLTIKGVYTSGYIALAVAVLGTASTWLKVYGYFG